MGEELSLTLLHSEWPKLYGVLTILSAIGLKSSYIYLKIILKCLGAGMCQGFSTGEQYWFESCEKGILFSHKQAPLHTVSQYHHSICSVSLNTVKRTVKSQVFYPSILHSQKRYLNSVCPHIRIHPQAYFVDNVFVFCKLPYDLLHCLSDKFCFEIIKVLLDLSLVGFSFCHSLTCLNKNDKKGIEEKNMELIMEAKNKRK